MKNAILLMTVALLFITINCNAQTNSKPEMVKDFDGNVYHTVTIGTQTWLIENLRTTHYSDGSAIAKVSDSTAWIALTTGAYCWYNNNITNKTPYGALYNCYAVNTGKLAPAGWHVPSDTEWTTLENYLIANGYNNDGTTSENKIAKSIAATTEWVHYSGDGPGSDLKKNNTSGFSALPGGCRSSDGAFLLLGEAGYWWSATEDNDNTSYAWERDMYVADSYVTRENANKVTGYSVRCLKD